MLPLQTHGVLLRVDFVSQDRCFYLFPAGGFEINVKYNNGKIEFISQKSIGQFTAQ